MKNYSIRLTSEQINKLTALSEEQERDISFLIRKSIDQCYGGSKPSKGQPQQIEPPKQVKPRKEAANGSYDLKDNESFVRLEGDLIVYKDEFGVFRRKKTPN